MKLFLVTIFSLGFFISCADLKSSALRDQTSADREYQVGAYLWFQTSGEYRALCFQAYRLAKMLLDRDLEDKHNRKRAVVFDIDETVLDNSTGGAYDIVHSVPWSKENLDKWVKLKAATAIPGARDFINYAASRQVEIIYISNRETNQIDDTYDNLKALGFSIKKENLYFRDGDSSKEKRRVRATDKYDVVLYFGDNLRDFHKDFDHKTSVERNAIVDLHKEDFGSRFIVLPNPLYGDWEDSLPKNEKRINLLKTFP